MKEIIGSIYNWALLHQPWGPTLAAFHTNSARDSRGAQEIEHLETSTFAFDSLKTLALLSLGAIGVRNGDLTLTAVAVVTYLLVTEVELGILSHLTRN